MDAGDIEGALELYADDAVLQAVKGKPAIRQTMLHSSAAGAGTPACHVVSNMRCVTEDDSVAVHCTVVAYLLDSPRALWRERDPQRALRHEAGVRRQPSDRRAASRRLRVDVPLTRRRRTRGRVCTPRLGTSGKSVELLSDDVVVVVDRA